MGWVEEKTGIDINPLNIVKKAVDWVIDEIVDPIVSTVGSIIDAALDNPIKTIAQIAALTVPGMQWTLPLIEAADVVAKGGDLGDALEAAAIAYVATEVGTKVGSSVGSAVAKETGSKVAGQIVGSAARGTTQAVVTGQDPVKAFISGGLNAAVPAALGKIDGYAELKETSPAAASAIAAYVSAEIAGGNGSKAAINAAVTNGSFVKKTIESAKASGINMTKEQEAIATDMLIRTTSAALTGGNVNAAIQSGLMKAGVSAIKDLINSEDANAAVTNVKTSYDKAQKAGDAVAANEQSQATIKTQYDKVALELQADIDKQNTLKAAYDKKLIMYNADKTDANANAVNSAAKSYNDFVSQLKLDVDDYYKPTLDDYVKQMDDLQANYDTLLDTYETTQNDLIKTSQKLDDGLDFAYAASDAAFVKAINPGFDADEYKKLNGLGADVDVYEHWLTVGSAAKSPTNLKDAQEQITTEKVRLISDLAEAKGISLAQISNTDAKYFFNNLTAKYGDNLQELKQAGVQDLLTGNTKSYDDLLRESKAKGFTIDVNGQSYGAWNKPSGYTAPSGTRLATVADMQNDTARLSYTSDGKPVWVTEDPNAALKVWDSNLGDYVSQLPTMVVTAPKLSDLKESDPDAWLVTASQLDIPATGGVDDFLYNFAAATMELAKTTNNSTLINAAGNALKAGGGILESFNGLVVLANKNPSNTALGKFASKLTKLGEATTTAEYKAAIKDIQKTIAGGQGAIGTGKAIWGAFKNHPIEFLAEYVGVEGMQELVPLMVGGGAATFAKGLALAKGMGVKAAERFGVSAGLKAAAVSDIAESIGGTAAGTYEEAYRAAIGTGMTEAQATQAALDIAARSGITSGVVTALSLGVGGAALEKAFFGNKKVTGEFAGVIDAIKTKMVDGAKVTVKEGVAESIEEGLVQAYTEGQLYKLDPTRDITGNIASSAIFGAIAGGGIAGTTMAGKNTGDFVSNVLMSNPAVNDVVTNATSATDLKNKLTNLGITNTTQQTNLLNVKYDANYTSSQEAAAALNARTDFTYSDADVAALVGNTADNKLVGAVEKYVDPRVLDIAEVKAAAALEGVTLTDEQAAQYAKQGSEADLTSALRTELDPTATTYGEAKQFLTDLGYTPSDAEVKSFVAAKSEADQKAAIEAYVDPRQVTAEEAREFLSASGYNPTDAEVKRFTGQVNEESQKAAIDKYVDPRYVDQGEVEAAWEALGLKKPTQDDIQKFIGQYAETDLTGKAEAYLPTARYNSVLEQLDALAATSGEDQNILDAIEVVKNDFSKQVEDLGFKIDTAAEDLADDISTVEKNVLEKVAEYEKAGADRDEALDKAITDVAADLGTTKKDILDQVGTPASVDENGDPVPATGIYAELADISTDIKAKYDDLTDGQKALADALVDQGETLQNAIDTAAQATAEQIGAPASVDENGEVIPATGIYAEIANVAQDTAKQIGEAAYIDADGNEVAATGVYAALSDVQKDLVDALVAQGETLQDAIDTASKATAEQIGAPASVDEDGNIIPATGIYAELADISTDIKAKYDDLTDGQKDLADALVAQGKDLKDAIDTASKATAEQIGTPASVDEDGNIVPATGIYAEIAGVSTDVQTKYDALTDGQKDLADALVAQGETLQDAIDTASKATAEQIGETETRLTTEIQTVADILGKPAQQVTQADIDMVADIIAQQQAEPTLQLTPEQLVYDVNQDGVVNADDQTLLDAVLKGTTEPGWAPPEGSPWAPTGVFAEQVRQAELTRQAAAEEAARTRQAAADEAERTRQAAAANALKTQRIGNLNTMMGMLSQASDVGGQKVTVKAPDPAKIGYVYDWSSIFANPSQQQLFASPFAKGGAVRNEVDDVNDELLRLLRG